MPKGVYTRKPEYRKHLRENILRLQKTRKYRPRTQEEKLAISIGTKKGMKGRSWNTGLTKETSESVRIYSEKSNAKLRTPENREFFRKKRMKQIFNVPESPIEKLIREELESRDIKFIAQSSLEELTIADFYLPDLKTIIYADGDYWHNRPEVAERDKRITKNLQDKGYKVFRFWEKDIKKNVGILLDSALNNNN